MFSLERECFSSKLRVFKGFKDVSDETTTLLKPTLQLADTMSQDPPRVVYCGMMGATFVPIEETANGNSTHQSNSSATQSTSQYPTSGQGRSESYREYRSQSHYRYEYQSQSTVQNSSHGQNHAQSAASSSPSGNVGGLIYETPRYVSNL
jgi:hypothetical protein